MSAAQDPILAIAFACEPNYGSEPGVGWDFARSMARAGRHVHVITHPCHRDAIERHLSGHVEAEPALSRLTFTYFGLPAPLSWLRRCQAGLNVYYYLWQLAVGRVARRLHDERQFAVVHHVTYARYWMPSGGAALAGPRHRVPFVWGPVGGGEDMPPAFRAGIGLRGRVLETLRAAARRVSECDPLLRRTARRADLTLATTRETAERLRRIGARRVGILSAIGCESLPPLKASAAADVGPARTVRFISAGRILYWKGFHLGIRAFAESKLENAEYFIVGDGPARIELQSLVASLGVADRVRFLGALPRGQFLAHMDATDVLVHPSLHDSGGGVCLEAMAAGKPVLCLALGGPDTIVTDATGIRVTAERPEQAVRDLASAMTTLAADEHLRHRLGNAGRKRCETMYDWDRRARRVESLYASIGRPRTAPRPPSRVRPPSARRQQSSHRL
jgi:glycosyltransferase involved in cell wall biosynthesis